MEQEMDGLGEGCVFTPHLIMAFIFIIDGGVKNLMKKRREILMGSYIFGSRTTKNVIVF